MIKAHEAAITQGVEQVIDKSEGWWFASPLQIKYVWLIYQQAAQSVNVR